MGLDDHRAPMPIPYPPPLRQVVKVLEQQNAKSGVHFEEKKIILKGLSHYVLVVQHKISPDCDTECRVDRNGHQKSTFNLVSGGRQISNGLAKTMIEWQKQPFLNNLQQDADPSHLGCDAGKS